MLNKTIPAFVFLFILQTKLLSQVCPTAVNNTQYNEVVNFGGNNENPSAAPFTYSFTPGAGTNRLMLLFITYETENTNGPNNFGTVSFGGKVLTNAVNQTITGAGTQHNRLGIYYLKESNIATAVGTTVSIAFSGGGAPSPNGSLNGIAVNTILLSNVDQTTPLLNIQSNTNVNTITITAPAALSATAGNLIIAGVNMALATATVGPSSPSYTVFISKQVATSHTHAVSYKKITVTGNEQPGFTANTSTRQIMGSVEVKANATGGSCAVVLPLHIVAFTGNLENNAVKLHWKTEEESDIATYAIQKSNNSGIDFFTIGSLASTHNNAPAEYSFTDVQLPLSGAYYRLQVIGVNGSVTYSNIIKIADGAVNDIKVISPFNSYITIYAGSVTRQSAIISLSDISGKQIGRKKFVLERGINSLLYPAGEQWAKGLYLLTVVTDNTQKTFRIIKE